MDIKRLVDKILEDGKLTKVEYEHLQMTLKADAKMDPQEYDQMHRVMDFISQGRLKVE